jgi:hypothetical protein
MNQPQTSASMVSDPTQGDTLLTPQSGLPVSPTRVDLNSSHSDKLEWFRQYFRPHFDSWVFGPIDRLVPSRDALISFIVMACAIDYLAGFWWGKSTKGKVRKVYSGFIERYFSSGRYDADGLYDSLRNGLVHMFTIKGRKYGLTHNQPGVHLKVDSSGQIILNAADFRDDLKAAKERYFDEVESDPDLLDNVIQRYVRDGFLALHGVQVT